MRSGCGDACVRACPAHAAPHAASHDAPMLRNGTARDGTERHASKTPEKILAFRIARLPVDNPKPLRLDEFKTGRPAGWKASDEAFAAWLAALQDSRTRVLRLAREHPEHRTWSLDRGYRAYSIHHLRQLVELPTIITERTA